ncbi:MAG TPA: winged helix-turn-helix transcriptional regulator [Methylomirabilota bacterium]|nr:winged helix-turn-helix transcriptional regulator [Methylomirabilota bacterium]
MKGYGQFCPIAMACETFAERWTPLILRELLNGGRRFGEIRMGLPLISRTLLAQRLRELEAAGVIESRPRPGGRGREYLPTRAAEELRAVLNGLGQWGQRWAATQFDPENLDLQLLLWNVRRRIDFRRLPPRRVVVRFDFRAFPPRCRPLRTAWLLLERTGSDVCLKDPGHDVDLVVSADAGAMARVWMGALRFAQAVREGGLRLEGPRDLVRAFPTWLLLSHFAHVERPARAG